MRDVARLGPWKLITGHGNSLNPDKRHALGIQSQVQNWRRGKYDFDIEVMTQEKNHTQLEQRGKKKTYVARSSAIFLMLDHEKVVEPMCR